MANEKPVKKTASWRAGFLAGVASCGLAGGGVVGVKMNNDSQAIKNAETIQTVDSGNMVRGKMNMVDGKPYLLKDGATYSMRVYEDGVIIGVCDYKKESKENEVGCWKFDAVRQ